MTYTPENVRASLDANAERLFAPWRVGRPENWVPSRETMETVCLAFWIREELTKLGLSEADRKTQEGFFHRYSRSDTDLCAIAANVLNDAVAGNIPQNRKPTRRWG